jgi:hypothetical protein
MGVIKFNHNDLSHKWPRDAVIEGLRSKCPPEEPVIVISKDANGDVFVAGTGDYDEAMQMLAEATDFLEDAAVEAEY